MEDLTNLIKLYSEEVTKEPLFEEFLALKTLIENDFELTELSEKLKYLQKMITLNIADKVKHGEFKHEYEITMEAYQNHPYIVNYNNISSEVESLLLQIKAILEA